MKYYSKTIVELLENEIEKVVGNKIIIKLENFQDLSLYYEVCKELKDRYSDHGIDLVIKLSMNKYLEAKEQNYDKINIFEENNWIDLKNHMTNYRNMSVNRKTIILLLGTELVEDRGGLEDFFLISPETIDQCIKEEYSLFFSEKFKGNSIIDGYEGIIDSIFKTIFSYYPKNLYKLSCLVNELPVDVNTIDNLVETIFSRLYKDWSLPRILTVPSRKELKGKKINVLEKAIKFARRSDFKDLTKAKLSKLEKQLDKFESEILSTHEISGDDFLKIKYLLKKYAKGKEIERVKEELFNMDFTLIESILQMKLTKGKGTKKDEKLTLKGEPFEVISKALLSTTADYLSDGENNLDIENIELSFSEIGIAEISEDQDELFNVWRNICNFTGGILEFLNKEGIFWNTRGEEINIGYEIDKEFFSITNAKNLITSGVLKKLPVTKKLSTIKFLIKFNKDNEYIHSQEVEWKFKNNEDWLMSFSFLNKEFLDEAVGGKNTPFIPSGTVKNIRNFLYLNDEEEFFDLLEKNEMDLKSNICKIKVISQNKLSETFQLLGLEFNKLLNSIYDKGVFTAINQGNVSSFLQRYKASAKTLRNIEVDQESKEILEIFIKLFSVVDLNENIESSLDLSSAIIPPYHPATLEKLQERFLFLRAGIAELFHSILKKPSEDKKVIDQKIKLFNELSSIQSSVDVLIGANKKYLDTRGIYGLYSILSSKELEESNNKRLDYNTILKKENALTDEGIKYKESSESRLITKIINDYINIYPSSIDGFRLSFVNPKELQPIISSLNSLVESSKNILLNDDVLKIKLNIFLSEENIGGKSYLAYWIENIFEEDSNIDIEIYYNTHSTKDDLNKNIKNYLDKESDLIFVSGLLEENDVDFQKVKNIEMGEIENKFPMMFKPLPVRKESNKRSIELSQPQFSLSTAHSNLVCKVREGDIDYNKKSVIKEYSFTDKSKLLLNELKKKCKWTICLEKGIDQHLLAKSDENNIIGFFPGQGTFGEYNLTISGNNCSLDILKKRLQTRLKKNFAGLSESDIENISKNLFDNISDLNGSRVLRALNVNDFAINDFLAYFLTYKLSRQSEECWGLIPLDYHMNWFSSVYNRPDFLKFEIIDEDNKKLKIKATVIECKFAGERVSHIDKAKTQVEEGYKSLVNKFSPKSTSIEKRYWFSQLYKNMVYSELLEEGCLNKYYSLNNNLFKILEGEFEIEWKGEIFAYWNDSDETDIKASNISNRNDFIIDLIEVPSASIEGILLGSKDISVKKDYCNQEEKDETEATVTPIGTTEEMNPEFSLHDYLTGSEDPASNTAEEPELVILENNDTKDEVNSITSEEIVNSSTKERLLKTLDVAEESNDIESERKYGIEKLRTLCTSLRKNNVDADPYDDRDNGVVIGPNFIKLKLKLDVGTSVSKLEKFAKDIKLWLSLEEIPIIYADKGYAAVEISRKSNLIIKLGNVLSTLDLERYNDGLKFILGIDEDYNPYFVDLSDSNNPHLLIAGATGSGKSVLINSIIITLMTIYTPKELEFIFIDPKVVELAVFEGNPYLNGRPISTTAEMAQKNLEELVQEMDNRYRLIASKKSKNIESYNQKVGESEKLKRIVVIFDEFADFMEDKTFKDSIESSIKRISAKARAAGIHMIICTQSPRNDVITTTIRNNLGARVALRVPDYKASNLILDESGSENLKGKGDMLFKSPNSPSSVRLKSPYLSEEELERYLEELENIY